MTTTPPALLGATAVRLHPGLPHLVAAAVPLRPVLHVGRPPQGRSWCYQRPSSSMRPAGWSEARSLPLCRRCMVELARGGRPTDFAPSRHDVAAWYLARIDLARDVPGGRAVIDGLVSEVIVAGLSGLVGCWQEGDVAPYPLHELFAPYRQVRGGLAERSAAARHLALAVPGAARELRGWSA